MRNWVATLLVLAVFLMPIFAKGQTSPALTLKTHIPLTKVEGRMDHLGVDVKGQRLFATAFTNKTLEVSDLKTGKQVHTITGLDQPQGAYYNPATNWLFVASEGDGTAKVFD